jgi:hypothetical protein
LTGIAPGPCPIRAPALIVEPHGWRAAIDRVRQAFEPA